ncbi:hydroxyacylglutathione hydrolase [Photorhabdus khanii]|uniref:Hydroxyacylglutathione hydrolase n=1 Tax=Photorhabdus khanii TaxID=1004150 RepID=A0A7C9KBQ4_9GAMM|nr:hydroxyacylglutathione hydrolase [Photorhabdus khanii]MQL46720.1 hydroxyacylglutathione hydrolase [Photorhabdus khanii]
MKSMPVWDLAIVGAGQSAKAILMSLAQARAFGKLPGEAFNVVVFSDAAQLGAGLAWDAKQNHAIHLSSLANAYPRGKFGAEEHPRFQALINHLYAQKVHIEVVYQRVSIIRQQTELWQISSEEGAPSSAHNLVLALGYSAYTEHKLGLAAPCFSTWPFMPMVAQVKEALQHNEHENKIAVVGGYLTAVDTVCGIAESLGQFALINGTLTYVSDRQYTIDWHTRDGFLPKVWGKEPDAFKGKYLTWGKVQAMLESLPQGNYIKLQDLIRLVMLELASGNITAFDERQCAVSQFIQWLRDGHQGHPHHVLKQDIDSVLGNDRAPVQYEHAKPLGYQRILFGTLPMVSELSARLSPQDKLQFEQRIRSLYYSSAMPMALVNASRIDALIRAGYLEVVVPGTNGRPENPMTSAGNVAAVINATGFDTNLYHSPSSLVQQMIRDGIIVPQSFGNAQQTFSGMQVEPDNCRLISRVPGGACRAYAMGPLVAGTFIDAQSIGHVHRDAERIVKDLCN